jgi:chromosome segregation ATPase
MARSGIRYEEVRDAAETLLGRGLNPTIQRVRELLGTGSNTTISEHLKSWQQQLADAPRIVLPPTVPEAVMAALDAFWKIAVQHAEAAFEEQRATAARAVAEAEQLRDAALADQRQAQAEAAEFRRQLETAQAAVRDLADRLLVEQERRTVAETVIQAAEDRARAAMASVGEIRAETEARIAQMDATLQQQRIDGEHQQAEARQNLADERQRNEAHEARFMQMLDRERTERAAEQQAFAVERQERQRQEAAIARQLEETKRENNELQREMAQIKERLNQSTANLESLQAALQERETRIQETERASDILQVRLETEIGLRQRLEQENAEIRKLFGDIMAQQAST